MFSNATETMKWQDKNCARCWKAIDGEELDRHYRCRTQLHIDMGYVTGELPKRVDAITEKSDCPYRQEQRPVYKKHGGEMPLFERI